MRSHAQREKLERERERERERKGARGGAKRGLKELDGGEQNCTVIPLLRLASQITATAEYAYAHAITR